MISSTVTVSLFKTFKHTITNIHDTSLLQVALQFLLDYPLGKRLRQHLEFFVRQLDYEHESGRESALEMVASMFAAFPQVSAPYTSRLHDGSGILVNHSRVNIYWICSIINSLLIFSRILFSEISAGIWCFLLRAFGQ